MSRRSLAAGAVAAGLLLTAPAASQADMFINAKSFSTQEAVSLSRSIIGTFSDDKGAAACDPASYTSTVNWGDGTPVEPASVIFRFGGDFTLCEYTVSADHKYAHFGIFTTTVSVSGGPLAHSAADTGEITVADVNITGVFRPFVAAAGTTFNGVVAAFQDANPLSQAGDFTSSIDWGDGIVSTGQIGGTNGAFTVSGAHTYGAPGTYTVRTVLQHPTGPPAVAVGTVTVGAAAPPAGGPPAGGGGGGTVGGALPTVQMRLLSSSLRKTTLRSKGMAVRLTVGNSKARTLKVEILRNAKHFASSTLKLSRTDGKAQTVRWKPSKVLLAKLKTGVTYGFRVSIGKQATAARSFRLSATPR
jgi:hypothetical protein